MPYGGMKTLKKILIINICVVSLPKYIRKYQNSKVDVIIERASAGIQDMQFPERNIARVWNDPDEGASGVKTVG
ncbi:uncharacterized protein RAG0_03415 [Rhynchosporium agropyri]|uniref:Uncharacterized protein n=2 Tax=Rhynchosporium TaxID=38037 RepID=A0A1E1K8G4_9HELO|nr:uncharacterized protein RAG0_03415 [Rhynchosporium agropyri]CZT05506.1 uncharacterized protein RCO7_14817 [Rhynchosporium commune]